MNILIEIDSKIPVSLYGGTQRVVWYLAQALNDMGHKVTLLAGKGSESSFCRVIIRDRSVELSKQIPEDIDVVHFNAEVDSSISKPYVVTVHGNNVDGVELSNTIFVSKNHAERNGSNQYVYNGLNWDDYGKVRFDTVRNCYHFLGKAAWRVKNVKGAIRIIKRVGDAKLMVLGGDRINFKMGFRCTLTPKAKFYGMVGEDVKNRILNHSKGLIFPVLWDEPFGLAITESMYMGTPVFGTVRGSLPELVHGDVGFLSNSEDELAEAIRGASFSPRTCHEYAVDKFNARVMAQEYVKKYERVLNNGNKLV